MVVTKTKQVEESQTSLAEHQEELSGLNEALSLLGEATDCPKVFYENLEEALNHKNTINGLNKDLEIKQAEENPYDEQIEELKNTALQELDWEHVNDLTKVKDHQEFLHKLLTNKDSFVRKRIIDQNLAFLNQRLTYYLDKIGLPHIVEFQNDLSVIITQLGQDLDFDNLSRGERNRLILSLSWAFRDVWENLYRPINLLFIDELVDSGMDASGVESSIAVLKRMTRERQKNVFLISHKDELMNRVNHVLKVIKENGFTSYSTDIEILE
jgi:DNA repair exonuclease SbcCD ATPase subunit